MKEKVTKPAATLAAVGAGLLALAMSLPASAAEMTTADDLLNATKNADDWLTVHRTYNSDRYSPLDQINKSNVKDLKVAWAIALGGTEGGGFWRYGNIEGTPIVESGTMYMANGWSELMAIDLRKAGQGPDMVKWTYDPGVDKDWAGNVACCAINNRGVAVWGDSVIMNTLDGRMLRIKKDTGELVWETQLADPAVAETVTIAPLVVKDMAITGVSGAEYGIRGWLAAVDLNTGNEVWRRYTIPGPGEPGHETWKDDNDGWLTGGGSTWQTGSYDPDTNLLYWGVGNPGPDWDNEYRPGDNLYTSGMFALDADTGKVAFHFQYTPNDPYDYDGINENILVNVNIGGNDRKAFIHADRNGFFYAIDRTNGEFIYGIPFVKEVNWTRGLDKVTGVPLDYNPNSDLQVYVAEHTPNRTNKSATFCPNLMGGKNWMPMSYSPRTKMAYIPTIESCITVNNEEETPGPEGSYVLREWFSGGMPDVTTAKSSDGKSLAGSLTAVDVTTGRIVRKVDTRYPVMAGVLSTAGGLVFVAQHEGKFCAFDDESLDELWCFHMNTLTDAPTMSFAVDGKQYIAVSSGGWGTVPTYFAPSTPGLEKIRNANVLWVFAL
ncbi:MAG TPA: PQQ-dependent dehydrogenase, methanol/ethanol family [Alphaproteobacteria bacterium]